MAGLGRGLSSLLSDSKKSKEEKSTDVLNTLQHTSNNKENIVIDEGSKVVEIDLNLLEPSIYQPRKDFDDNSLKELSLSIKEPGLLEPLLVKKQNEGKYSIICGERRFRACKLANLVKVPCLVRDDLKENAYAIALIENIQREDLNPLELSKALEIMMSECNLKQDELAKTLGKSRSSIANLLRLNNLNEDVKGYLKQGIIELGHAKALLALDDNLQVKAAKYVVDHGLNVRQTEVFVKEIKEGRDENQDNKKNYRPESFSVWESSLTEQLGGVKVRFSGKDEDKGKLTLSYSTHQQLAKVLKLLGIDQ